MANPGEADWNLWLQGARRGDNAAINHLFREIEVRLRRVAGYRLWGQPRAVIDDLIQNTLLLFTEKWTSIESNPHLFAVQILHNKIYHLLRDQKGKHQISLGVSQNDEQADGGPDEIQLEDESVDIETQFTSREAVDRVKTALLKLGPFCRQLFLGIFEERTIAEIWELFQDREPELKRATFDKRIFDCRKRLRAELGGAL